jgi:hypothetical protein
MTFGTFFSQQKSFLCMSCIETFFVVAKWENLPKIKTLIGIGIILIFEYHNAINNSLVVWYWYW